MRKFKVTVNGQSYEVLIEEINEKEMGGASASVSANTPQEVVRSEAVPAAPVQEKPQPQSSPASPAGGTEVTAPMPGSVLEVKVQPGQQVKEGDVLLILEAMKMENEITAPCSGSVSQVNVTKGGTVNTGDIMVVIE
ncbi:MAG: biotin/lipoyl-binding protein [Firmicutes bacterium]|nr:biotin/lipoyl-binding protein [Bacillota bacterium]